jgi:hypothetical protein
MRTYLTHEGTKDEILAALDARGLRSTATPGKEKKADDIAEAWREVRDGAVWVEAGGAVYRVVEG